MKLAELELRRSHHEIIRGIPASCAQRLAVFGCAGSARRKQDSCSSPCLAKTCFRLLSPDPAARGHSKLDQDGTHHNLRLPRQRKRSHSRTYSIILTKHQQDSRAYIVVYTNAKRRETTDSSAENPIK